MRTTAKLLIRGFGLGTLLVAFAQTGMAGATPDVVELATLANMYKPTTFDHAMHVDVAACAVCHHHTTGTPLPADSGCITCHGNSGPTAEVACASCHAANPCDPEVRQQTASAATIFHGGDRTGLKRAYHLNCMGCHKEMGGPTGCEDCHPKKERVTE